MSLYQFLPNTCRIEALESFVTWNGGFSDEDVEQIKQMCAALQLEEAKVGAGENAIVDSGVRRTKVGWIKNQPETSWLYDKVAFIARSLNSQFYRFNLYGFVEDLQYTLYEEGDEGFYTWHIDQGAKTNCPRKLSLVIQLSDPSEYEGGELEILTSENPVVVDKQKGLVAAFPSYVLHRVTPVTKGTRQTLVVWCAGPDFI